MIISHEQQQNLNFVSLALDIFSLTIFIMNPPTNSNGFKCHEWEQNEAHNERH